jgi:hypothetical protein
MDPLNFQESNIGREIWAKVADFGLASYAAHKLADSLLTFRWAAPEVLNPELRVYDERADVSVDSVQDHSVRRMRLYWKFHYFHN